MMMCAWNPKISQSTCNPSWSGCRNISLLENVRSLQWPFMSREMYSAVARRIWDRLTWSLILLILGCTVPYASRPDNFPSLNRMWKKLRPRKCWTEASLSHARAAGLALLFWLLMFLAKVGLENFYIIWYKQNQ